LETGCLFAVECRIISCRPFEKDLLITESCDRMIFLRMILVTTRLVGEGKYGISIFTFHTNN
jgi:hypothetical protein